MSITSLTSLFYQLGPSGQNRLNCARYGARFGPAGTARACIGPRLRLDLPGRLDHHVADFWRRTSYPTSGYSLGQRGARGSRRLLAPRTRETSLLRQALADGACVVLG